MSLKKDKQKVLGETFDEERIAGFLAGEAPEGQDRDFYLLERAYRGMRAEDFATFVQLFLARGGDLNARNSEGQTLLDRLLEHRQSSDYAEVLRTAAGS
ncbi:PA4642 family protein [Microbulbifer guangxiensis]|uniref:PA4642 family protein n=1 Tax=Microbulbifer guangxiensis TaxID=2904249 RepID=UPI001F25FE40|nr:PA4642 family protein [Microbulbifer guangxiensis]